MTGDASLHAMIAEALTREADGIVTIKALAAIDRGLAANPMTGGPAISRALSEPE